MRRAVIAILTASLLWGCAAMTYSHRYDPAVDFGRLRTYALMPIPEKAKEDKLLLLKGMRFAVDSELRARGYSQVGDKPDFLVALHATTERRVDVQEYGYASSYGFRDHPAYLHEGPYPHRRPLAHVGPEYYDYRSGVDVYEYRVGTLIVDIVSTDKRELVWRGTAHGELPESFTQEDMQRIVGKILGGFPPPRSR